MLDIDYVSWTWIWISGWVHTSAHTQSRHAWTRGWVQPLIQNHIHETSSMSNTWPISSRLSLSVVSSMHKINFAWGGGAMHPYTYNQWTLGAMYKWQYNWRCNNYILLNVENKVCTALMDCAVGSKTQAWIILRKWHCCSREHVGRLHVLIVYNTLSSSWWIVWEQIFQSWNYIPFMGFQPDITYLRCGWTWVNKQVGCLCDCKALYREKRKLIWCLAFLQTSSTCRNPWKWCDICTKQLMPRRSHWLEKVKMVK